jgi:uncharacterized protein YjbI with pentapeptide repeats
MDELNSREQEIREIWRDYKHFYRIIGGFALVSIGLWIGSILFSNDVGYGTNLFTEALGVLVTIAVLDRLNDWRSHQQLKDQLVQNAGNRDNSTAVSAVDRMRNENWLEGEKGLLRDRNLYRANLNLADFGNYANLEKSQLAGSQLQAATLYAANLRSTDLSQANLAHAYLREANLEGAKLTFAILQGANLKEANLKNTDFSFADLSFTKIWGSNLQNAILRGANLEEANMYPVDLRGADLSQANLTNADMRHIQFNEDTILPDGSNWSEGTDLEKFTNPDHPEYQRYAMREMLLGSIQSL